MAAGGLPEAVLNKATEVGEAVEEVEEPVIESPVKAVSDKVIESKAVEVVDKVEEPGVDAKVVESPDLALSQLLEKIRRLEETKEGPNLRVQKSLEVG